MKTFLASFLISFLYVAAVTPFLIYIGKKYGLVDAVNHRKIHRGAIPRIGGVAISTGTLIPIILLLYYHNDISEIFFSDISNSIVIIIGGLIISLLGLLDDIKGVSAKYKFLVQILLACIAWYFGFNIPAISTPLGVIQFGFFNLPITVLWIVGVINAFNLIDGMDGLSSGVAFFVSITLLILSIHNTQLFVALISASMAGAVVGFLVYNFNPAKIFMGDAGSMFIGYILAILSVKGASKHQTMVSLLIPIMAMGLPILDTTLAFVRRFVRNQPIFLADRQHIHHILLSKGLNQRKVVMILYGISVMFTMLALFSIFLKDTEVFLILMVFAIIVFVMITKLGYMEMFYGRYRLNRQGSMEDFLEKIIVDRLSTIPLKEMESLIFSLPIKGFAILDSTGKEIFESGTQDPVNFLDVKGEKEHFLRFYWKGVVPTITSREATMFSIMSKSLVNYIGTEARRAK